jgi:hypothetical protein
MSFTAESNLLPEYRGRKAVSLPRFSARQYLVLPKDAINAMGGVPSGRVVLSYTNGSVLLRAAADDEQVLKLLRYRGGGGRVYIVGFLHANGLAFEQLITQTLWSRHPEREGSIWVPLFRGKDEDLTQP